MKTWQFVGCFGRRGLWSIILKSQGLTGMESPGSRRANFHNNPMTCVKVKGHDVIRMNTLTRQPLGGGGGLQLNSLHRGACQKKLLNSCWVSAAQYLFRAISMFWQKKEKKKERIRSHLWNNGHGTESLGVAASQDKRAKGTEEP